MASGRRAGTTPRRLKDIADPVAREHAAAGVQITLEANLAHLRSIKDTEHKWLDLYAILTLPGIGYLMSVDDKNPLIGWPLAAMLALYLVITAWLQYVLLRERFSYYSVLRSVVRSQNLLGLLDINYLSQHFAGSPFPQGFGPKPNEDGTQPESSFLRRLLYVTLLYIGLLLAAAFRWWPVSCWSALLVPGLCLLLELAVMWFIFRRDRKILTVATRREAGLAGYEDAWFPSS